ncbi:peripheral myelin protein 22-like isoform X1 [Clinocottus analis]|uniref:peripheral myelin protein 22-like isoform X1 n=2 Tax=Clinocottus analis TaxID=304258 RepID=UPI0035C0FBBA
MYNINICLFFPSINWGNVSLLWQADEDVYIYVFCSAVNMLILLAAIFVLHIIGIILLLVATIDNAWWMTEDMSTDVWFRWLKTDGVWNTTDLPTGSHYPEDYLQAVQASAVLACIFSILGIFVFVAQLFTLPKGQRFTISGIFQLLACLCIMIAASIYTDRFHIDEKFGWYGHCYILAWISFSLTFISSITYFVLRKKTA